MTRTLRIRKSAEHDVREARDWYDEQVPGLGDAFLDEFVGVLDRIVDTPLLYRERIPDVRMAQLRRFPWNVYFGLSDTSVVVVAVAQASRDPAYWMSRT